MKNKICYKVIVLAVLAVFVSVSCRKMPSVSDFDGEFMVYTACRENVDFNLYKTFTVADSLVYFERDRGRKVLDEWGKAVRSQYIKYMTDRGFVYVDTGSVDLGLQISYVVSTEYFTSHVTVYPDYWWGSYPGYWYPGYWGDWGRWQYSFPITYGYSTHSLLAEIVDLTAETGKDKPLPVLWNSYIDGQIGNAMMDRNRFSRAILQSFSQSEYLRTNSGL